MKLTADLLREMVAQQLCSPIKEAKYGYRRDRTRSRDMNYGVKWEPKPKEIDYFSQNGIPAMRWVEEMDNWLIRVSSNPKMAEFGYKYTPISEDVTSAINSATKNGSFSREEYDLILSALKNINEKIEEITSYPVGGPKQKESILNYRMPEIHFTIGRHSFIRGED